MQEHHYLQPLLEPRSVAVIGASERQGSLGRTVIRNLLDGGYTGRLFAVNPKHKKIFDLISYPTIEEVPHRIELAVICVAAEKVLSVVEGCGRAGVKMVVILSAGFAESGPRGERLERQLIETARRYHIRILGPNCLGVMRPHVGLNASFVLTPPLKGSIGFISHSGALCSAVLDWAKPAGVGFSAVVSLGASADIDFAEVLDFLAQDYRTEAIVLYIEGIKNARRFMSALRAAARIKPVLVLKAGRHPEVMRTIHLHAGHQPGDDKVFDAALRRSGVIRLYNTTQLYAALSALFARLRPRGNKLAILSNGGGLAAMAADRAADLAIPLAELSSDTVDKLNALLPANWSHANPVDILGDADADRYGEAFRTLLAAPEVDGILVILAPQAMTNPTAVAERIIEIEAKGDKPVVTCWMGDLQVDEARQKFVAAGIPTFRAPEPAVELFSHVSSYYRNQKLLAQTPPPLTNAEPPRIESTELIIEAALTERRLRLNEMEAKAVLSAFRIPIAQAMLARTVTEAIVLAEEIGLPVAMKIQAKNVLDKADSGGVRLNLTTMAAVRTAFQEIIAEVRRNAPDAEIEGVVIEPMVIRRYGREVMIRVKRDPVFGPVIYFGEGGKRATPEADMSVALPPFNTYLAHDLIRSSRIYPMLQEWRNMPAVALERLESVLLRVSEMVCELPWIEYLSINPLIVDENDAIALDAKISLTPTNPSQDRYAHMAIHPYPSHLVQHWTLPDGTDVLIRPIRPEDAELEAEFVRNLSPQTKYFRFMTTLNELPPAMLARLTQIDYDREMAFIAVTTQAGKEVELGVARYAVNPDGESCEFAIVVADEWQHRGLARKLMQVLIETARNRGLKEMRGVFLANNERMLRFVASLGFTLTDDPEDRSIKLGVLPLQPHH
ncbi:GNAT family N-acetyltransferase [Hydrogenophilus islandicus]